MDEIFLVKNSLGETTEKAWKTVLENLASRTKKRGFRIQVAAE
jgi:hypothetical protein